VSAVEKLAQAVHGVGYRKEAVLRDYAFVDVLTDQNVTRVVPLVAFTQTPPSYRSAALAVVQGDDRQAFDIVQSHRALGAPLLFLIQNEDVTVWQVRSPEPPRPLEKVRLADVQALFQRHRTDWHPDAIHRAKAVGTTDKSYQLDFVDLGLLPAIEGEIHIKLDRILVETLDLIRSERGASQLDARTLFRVVFRLLAAKVLQDRQHPFTNDWRADDLQTVLAGIEGYYSLERLAAPGKRALSSMFEAAWQHLRNGISFSNISADDLAFVYENTLVTPEARKLFGTHSTPRQLAEYIVQRLNLHSHRPETLRIYEPFAGAGVFLVSALRHLRNLLPIEWSDQERHNFLIGRLAGDEIDPFACEVATLSLILADYPNHNGWHIQEVDLFKNGILTERMNANNIIVCNPPFEAFSDADKRRYSVASTTHSKAIAALSSAVEAHPIALGFVLPRSFILERQFAEQRRKIESLYGSVEIIKLPDGIFGASEVESSAVIASEPRKNTQRRIAIRSTEVAERDRTVFLKTGHTTVQRVQVRTVENEPAGNLWIPALSELWQHLDDRPLLESIVRPRWGLRWNYDQVQAASSTRKPGYKRGLLNARGFQQFVGGKPTWLDFNIENLREGYDQPWSKPKLIMNATRLRRGAWPMAVSVDEAGLLYSQQFFGLWPKEPDAELDLHALCAVLNGPIANVFLAVNSPKDRFRAAVVGKIPLPRVLPKRLSELTKAYVAMLQDRSILNDNSRKLIRALAEIDGAVLEAYDLPLKLEKQLLSFFRDAERPVQHSWAHWDDLFPTPGLSLPERLSGRFNSDGDWISKIFRQLPDDEISLLRDYVD
jgi:hypothetical protein